LLGESGFQIITPFYCYRNSKGELQALLVDRGWIPFDLQYGNRHIGTSTGMVRLIGSFYKGESSNKYR
jgi:cytochrome oxidase assembly protein ShyY1